MTGGVVYVGLGLCAGLATSLVTATPPLIITAVAGLAMLGALVGGLSAALEKPENRIVAIVTFLVVASGIVVLGIGSPFWGLLVGGVVMLWLGWNRRRIARAASPGPGSAGSTSP